MRTFLKFQTSSFISTIVDYSITIFLTENFKILYIISSVIGFVSGGVINFCINKNWVFKTKNHNISKRAFLYIAVWIITLLINTLGLYLLTYFGNINYKYSKIIVSIIVGIVFSYFAQKRIVFYALNNI